MAIVDNWLADIPQQFRGKENIEVLFDAFAEQLQEISDVFEDLKIELDIDDATGLNLDRIGDIICMSRSEAWTVLKSTKDETITDDIYRKVLKWKLLKNTCECTYADVMKSIELIWDASKITYKEDPDYPAHIFLTMDEYDIDDDDPTIGKGLPIKAAGVSLTYLVGYYFAFLNQTLESLDNFAMNIRACIDFWETQLLDGSIMLDGEAYYLDGSLILDGDYNFAGGQSYLNASRRYNLILGFAESIGEFETTSSIDNPTVTVSAYSESSEELEADKVTVALGIDNFGTRYLDGSEILDGSETFWTAHVTDMNVEVTGCEIETSEEVGTATVTTTSANGAFLSGIYLLNGAILLDKINEVEEV